MTRGIYHRKPRGPWECPKCKQSFGAAGKGTHLLKALHDAANSNSYHPAMYDYEQIAGGLYWSPPSVDYAAQAARLEDQLRTYMIGGVTPTDLEGKAKDADAACKARVDAYEVEKTERRLTKEYGPRQ